MPKLKAIEQDTWLRGGGGPSRGGVCYYMCSFLESDKGPWEKPGYQGAVAAVTNFGQSGMMMNYAKAQNLRKAIQTGGYVAVPGGLDANRIYRAGLWVGAQGEAPAPANHEIILVTGATAAEIVYFEPNFGFYVPTVGGGANNRTALEQEIAVLYAGVGRIVGNFSYLNVRANTAATPKGFTA